MLIQGISEATDSVKSIGLNATLILILMAGIFALVSFIIKWAIKRIDKKDEIVLQLIEQRRQDLKEIEITLRASAEAYKDGAREMKLAFGDLANEIRRQHHE